MATRQAGKKKGPAKKAGARKASAKRVAAGKRGAKTAVAKARVRPPKRFPLLAGEAPCDLQRVCTFLQKLSNWLTNDFLPDYTKLRIAVCNVEKQAFSGNGNPNSPPRFCTGGGGNEPAAPKPPPVW